MNWFTQEPPIVLGHRGASAHAPENTLVAFHLALEQGAVGFEFDVQLSAEGVPVVIHDGRVDRTTNGTGRVQAMRVEQLQALDAGDGETIPTLETVFATFGNRILYNVEIKDYGWRDSGTERTVADLIRKHGLAGNVLVSSFSPLAMLRARQVMPAQTLLALIRMRGFQQYGYHLFSGDADHPHYRLVNPAYMAWARKRGYLVNAWTVDDPAVAQRLVALGVTGLITNTPQTICAALG